MSHVCAPRDLLTPHLPEDWMEDRMASRMTGSAGEIVSILRDGQPRTKSELAALTGQARSTISQRLDRLTRAGLVGTRDLLASTGGRPSAAYEFLSDSQLVLVVDLGARHATMALTNLLGDVRAHRRVDLRIDAGPEVVLATAIDQLEELLNLQPKRLPLIGVGVGLPGPVEHSTGRPMSPPIMPGWSGYDVVGRLHAHFGVPVYVDNDANLLALGERTLAWPDIDDLIYVKVATGVGAGVIAGGELVRGAQGVAGDIGHVYIPAAEGRDCRCGNTGCVETIAGGLSLAAQLSELGLPARDATDVAALTRAGNLEAIRAVREAGRAIGSVLATCIAILNPRVIALGGELAAVGEPLIAGIRESIYARALPLASQHLRVVTARSGELGGVIGAANMVLAFVLNPDVLEEALDEA
jgi:predicted NBD/HSP70 family sugar kinase